MDKFSVIRTPSNCPIPYMQESRDVGWVKLHGYGPNFRNTVRTEWKHRENYTIEDAQAVCDWLNQRARGYALQI